MSLERSVCASPDPEFSAYFVLARSGGSVTPCKSQHLRCVIPIIAYVNAVGSSPITRS